jgi:hypothetical protein
MEEIGRVAPATATASMMLVRFATLWFAVLVGFVALSLLKRRYPGLLAGAPSSRGAGDVELQSAASESAGSIEAQ